MQNQFLKIKEFLEAFVSRASIEDLQSLVEEAAFDYPEFKDIKLQHSIKYLYGTESWVLMFHHFPLLRIAGDGNTYRIMTPTTSELIPVDRSILNDLLDGSELFGKLLDIELLRLSDNYQRPFNVIGEFTQSPVTIEEKLREVAWVFLVICVNSEIFSKSADSQEFSSSTKFNDFTAAHSPWSNEKLRDPANQDLRDLYRSLCDDDEEQYVYLMDGCWLTPSGEIVER